MKSNAELTEFQKVCPHLSPRPWPEGHRWGGWKAKASSRLLREVWTRVYIQNKDVMCLNYGERGSGKSYTCLAFLEMVDPNFTIDNVVFDVQQFFNFVQSDKCKQGSGVLFEELGVAANSRSWFTADNKALSYITQIIRTKNLIVMFTAPDQNIGDSQVSKMVNMHFEAQGVNLKEKVSMAKVFYPVWWNEKTKRWYRSRFIRKVGPYIAKVALWKFKKASKHLLEQYTIRRDEYMAGVINMGQQMMEDAKTKVSQKKIMTSEDLADYVSKVIAKRDEYMDDRRFNIEKVQSDFDLGLPNAKKVKAKVKSQMESLGFGVMWR